MVVKREHLSAAAHHKGRSEVEGEGGREAQQGNVEKKMKDPEVPRVANKQANAARR